MYKRIIIRVHELLQYPNSHTHTTLIMMVFGNANHIYAIIYHLIVKILITTSSVELGLCWHTVNWYKFVTALLVAVMPTPLRPAQVVAHRDSTGLLQP